MRKIRSRAPSSVTICKEIINRKKAERYLKLMGPNRTIIPAHIKKLTKSFLNPVWIPSILIFDWLGRLIDGQHRLKIIAEKDGEVEFVIVRGVDPRVSHVGTPDIPRSIKHSFQILQRTHAKMLSVLCISFFKFFNGNLASYAGVHTPTNEEAMAIDKKYPQITVTAEKFGSIVAWKEYAIKPILFVHAIGEIAFPGKGDEFVTGIIHGDQHDVDHPFRLLHDEIQTRRLHRCENDRTELIAFTIMCWNAFLEGKPLRMGLRWTAEERKKGLPKLLVGKYSTPQYISKKSSKAV